MAISKTISVMGLTATDAYIRPEVFFRTVIVGEMPEESAGKTFNSVIRVYANQAAIAAGLGALKDFNVPFVKQSDELIEAACYAALKARPDMAGALDC